MSKKVRSIWRLEPVRAMSINIANLARMAGASELCRQQVSEVGLIRVRRFLSGSGGQYLANRRYSADLTSIDLLAALLRSGSELRRAGPAGYPARSSRAGQQATGPISSLQATRLALLLQRLIFKPQATRLALLLRLFLILRIFPGAPH